MFNAIILLQVYEYDRLKISNFDLPKDVDRDQLEVSIFSCLWGNNDRIQIELCSFENKLNFF